ncbi:hypothetical protein LWI29_034459 [Acer saccharum]|uniref:Cytochrome P450 n=1 Tax=Acer saccharum TaxID=4024 RepID=A0AA39VG99_ACESA|nr:hypothetical protein LWI29_034459 [Acer saccharum]
MEGGDQAYYYKFVPFGLGRQACPGAGFANRVMSLALAALIQCFEWERISEEEADMSEGTGITMPKAKPLEAMCKSHHSMSPCPPFFRNYVRFRTLSDSVMP